MESDSDKNLEFKVIHKLNFRCVTCQKVYGTEEGVKKHIRMSHGIMTPTSIHYSSFVGEKRIKVPNKKDLSKMVNTEILENPEKESNQSSPSVSSVSYSCAMCDKEFPSYDEVRGHLTNFHGITRPMSHDMFSYNFSPKPMLKTSKQPCNILYQLGENDQSETMAPDVTAENVPGDIGEKQQKKLKDCLKNKKSIADQRKGKAKTKVDFCSSLFNMFTNGSVKMESLNMWGKKKPKLAKDSQCKNNNQEIKPSQDNTTSGPNDDYHPQQNVTPGSKVTNPPQQNNTPGLQDTNPTQENTTPGPHDNNRPQQNTNLPQQNITRGLQDNNIPQQNTSPGLQDTNHNFDKHTQPNSSHVRHPQPMRLPSTPAIEDTPLDSQRRLGEGDVNRPKIQRRKKKCDDAECGPCSVLIDCMECRFCVKRNLNQRCFYRQCPRLNSRFRRKATDVQQDVEQSEEDILVSFLSTDFGLPVDLSIDSRLGDMDSLTDSIENSEEDNSRSEITDIIEEIVLAAWGKVNKDSESEDKAQYQRKKCYPCPKCGTLFVQYASSLKHCTVKKVQDTGAVCPVCGKKVLLKRNLKRHIKTVHDPNRKHVSPETSQGQLTTNNCEHCGKVYSSKNKLVEHLRNKHGVVRKGGPLIKCSECDFSHIRKGRVKAHFTVAHNSEQTFKCTLCGVLFRSKSGLQKHTNNVHKPKKSLNQSMTPDVPENIVAKKSLPPSQTNFTNPSQSIAAKNHPLSRVFGNGFSPGFSVQNLLPVQTAYHHALQPAPQGQNQLPMESDFSEQNVFPKPGCLPSAQFPQVGVLSQNTSCVIMARTPTGFTSQNISQVLRNYPQPDQVLRGNPHEVPVNTHSEQFHNPSIPVNNNCDLVQGGAVNSYSMAVDDPGVPVVNLNMTQDGSSPSLPSNNYNNMFTESGFTYQNL